VLADYVLPATITIYLVTTITRTQDCDRSKAKCDRDKVEREFRSIYPSKLSDGKYIFTPWQRISWFGSSLRAAVGTVVGINYQPYLR
jgi:hypothetical protein